MENVHYTEQKVRRGHLAPSFPTGASCSKVHYHTSANAWRSITSNYHALAVINNILPVPISIRARPQQPAQCSLAAYAAHTREIYTRLFSSQFTHSVYHTRMCTFCSLSPCCCGRLLWKHLYHDIRHRQHETSDHEQRNRNHCQCAS